MKQFILLMLLCLVYTSMAALVAHEFNQPVEIPSLWRPVSSQVDSEPLSIVFALKQQNLDKLDNIFWRVTDPRNSEYTNYPSLSELNALVAPAPEKVQKLRSWLRSHNMESRISQTPNADFITVPMSVSEARDLFQISTPFFQYEHVATHKRLVRTAGPYHLPEELSEMVDFVGGLVRFPGYQPALSMGVSSVGAPMQMSVTPDRVKLAFNMPSNIAGNASGNSMSVNQFLGQWYDNADLASFQQRYSLPQQAVANIYGPNDPSQPGVEAQLDIEYIMGTAPQIPTWFISFDALHENQESFLKWIVNMSSTANAPLVYSVSYGDVEASLSLQYTSRVNVEFQKFGASGHSIIFASGDDGTGCNQAQTKFVPNFPASSPFVTAVGGINLDSLPHSFSGWAYSSGGFSNYFPRPSYQDSAVSKYLAQTNVNLPSPSFYNKTGRAMPDVAAFSSNVIIVYQGSETPVGGTSCAAPQFSGITGLLNDARLNAGKKPLGFLNNWIYQNPSMFQDVTAGRNSYGGCSPGFPATPGWDAITGFGAVDFPKVLASALSV